jgi:hypothetical protein
VAHIGEGEKVYKVLVGKPTEKRPTRRPRHRREDGIRMHLCGDWLGGGVWSEFNWLRIGAGGRLW